VLHRTDHHGRLRWAVPASVLVAAGVLLATGALASGHRSVKHPHHATAVHYSVFAHPLHHAKAKAAAVGATLAAVINSEGVENEIYVSQKPGEYCISDNYAGGMTGEACGLTEAVNEKGLDLMMRGHNTVLTEALLLPDGVSQATFVDSDGTEHPVEVQNNVVLRTDPNLESVRYVMPDAMHESVNVPSPGA
jgi:hypothetical protein